MPSMHQHLFIATSRTKHPTHLVDHHVRVWLSGLLGMSLVTICRSSIIHLHIITALFLGLLLFLLVVLAVLDVLAASLIVVGRASSVLGAAHSSILTLDRCGTLLFLVLFLFLFDAVLVAVCVEVGLGLVRGELGGSRLLRIPVIVSAVA